MAIQLDGTTGISATGNIWGNNITVTNSLSVGTFSPSVLSATGNVTGLNLLTTGLVSATANITGGNLLTGGLITATGNVDAGNLRTSGGISATGTIVGSGFVTFNTATGTLAFGTGLTTGIVNIGSTSQTGNILIGQSVANANINIGIGQTGSGNTANIYIGTNSVPGGTTSITVGPTATTNGVGTVLFASNTQVSIANTSNIALSVAGNVTGGNILTAGLVSATGTVTGSSHLGSVVSVTANVTGGNILTAGVVSATSSITGGSLATGGTASATGNITGGNILTAGLISATGNITGGNLLINTDATITGNLTVNGNTTFINSNVVTTNDKSITLANNQSTSANVDGSGIDIGNATIAFWRFNNATTSWQSNIGITPSANATLNIGGTSNYWATAYLTGASVSGNITGGNLLTGGLISATSTVTTAAGVTATGNITGGNILTAGLVSATGAVTGGSLATGGTASATGNITGGNILTAGVMSSTGNAVHGNILSNGQLSVVGNLVQSAANSFIAHSYGQSLTAAGTAQANAYVITATNNQFSTVASGSGAILPAGLPGQIVFIANDAANALLLYPPTGGLIDQASANAAITVSAGGMWMGTALGSNVWTTISPDSVGTANQITVTQGNGLVSFALASSPSVSGNITGGNILTGGLISATGNITGGNVTVATGTVTLGNIINANANAVGNIGSATNYFNTIFGKATTAQYADLAELYVSDADYTPGTVLAFGGTNEVTVSTASADPRIAGVVSTNPAHLMNSTLQGQHIVAVALTGRVPASVTGTVRKGDMMVSAGNGHAQASAAPAMGTVIGKALADFDGASGVIEIVVGRL